MLEITKFLQYITEEDINEFRELLSFHSLIVEPTEKISACRDSKDNIFLECAVVTPADYIVTGDSDLLILNPFRAIPIITAGKFLTSVIQ